MTTPWPLHDLGPMRHDHDPTHTGLSHGPLTEQGSPTIAQWLSTIPMTLSWTHLQESYSAGQTIQDSPNARTPSDPKKSSLVILSEILYFKIFFSGRPKITSLHFFHSRDYLIVDLHDRRQSCFGEKMKRWIEAFPTRLQSLSGWTHSRQGVQWFLVNNKNQSDRQRAEDQ